MSHPDIKQKINLIQTKLHENTLTPSELPHINYMDTYFKQTRLNAEKTIWKYNIPHTAD